MIKQVNDDEYLALFAELGETIDFGKNPSFYIQYDEEGEDYSFGKSFVYMTITHKGMAHYWFMSKTLGRMMFSEEEWNGLIAGKYIRPIINDSWNMHVGWVEAK